MPDRTIQERLRDPLHGFGLTPVPEVVNRLRRADEQRREAADRIDELEAIVDRLPKTADGVVVIPGTGTPLYSPAYHGTDYFEISAEWIEKTEYGSGWAVAWGGLQYDISDVSLWYSTEAAAREAMEETK